VRVGGRLQWPNAPLPVEAVAGAGGVLVDALSDYSRGTLRYSRKAVQTARDGPGVDQDRDVEAIRFTQQLYETLRTEMYLRMAVSYNINIIGRFACRGRRGRAFDITLTYLLRRDGRGAPAKLHITPAGTRDWNYSRGAVTERRCSIPMRAMVWAF